MEASLKVLPKFTTRASNVKVLFEPKEFYFWLLVRLCRLTFGQDLRFSSSAVLSIHQCCVLAAASHTYC